MTDTSADAYQPTMYFDVLEALGKAIAGTDVTLREELKQTLIKWGKDCPDDFWGAFGPLAPRLLSELLETIEMGASGACITSEPDPADRLRGRRPQGSA